MRRCPCSGRVVIALGALAAYGASRLIAAMLPDAVAFGLGALVGYGPTLAGAALAAAIFQWLRLLAQATLPAETTARLAELQSRIRPHFLFNTLNTAFTLVRLDPGKAEGVLEDLAELFRVAITESTESVSLGEEVDLAQRYLDIEQIRFGSRLHVTWELDAQAATARVPPLLSAAAGRERRAPRRRAVARGRRDPRPDQGQARPRRALDRQQRAEGAFASRPRHGAEERARAAAPDARRRCAVRDAPGRRRFPSPDRGAAMSADMNQSTAFPGYRRRLRVLVVDDEELARLRLRSLVGECGEPSAVVVGEAANAAQALVWLATRSCDLLLLDVQMPGRDGTQLAAELRLRTPGAGDRLRHRARRARAQGVRSRGGRLPHQAGQARAPAGGAAARRPAHRRAGRGQRRAVAAEEEGPVIVVSDRGRIIRVPVADVLYMKAELKYVTLRTAEHTHVLDDSLAELAERLGDRFLRVHRNALVARRAVRALERRAIAGENADDGLEGWGVCIAPVNEWLAVSRRQVAAVREALVDAER